MSIDAETEVPHTLVRGITRVHLIGLLINSIVGAGILGLPSKMFALVGSYSIMTWLLCACIVLAIALCLAEVSTRFRDSGGPYLYAHVAFGPTVAFITGWLRWFTTVLAFATVCNLLIGYLSLVIPAVAGGVGRFIVITMITGGLTVVLGRGLRGTVWMSTSLSIGKLLLLALFILVGAFFFDASRIQWAPVPAANDMAGAILLSIFAFFGFESGAVAGGEVADPERDQPVAILVSVGLTTLLFVLVQLVCIGTLDSLATSSRPVADAATAMLGSIGGLVVTVGAVAVLLGVLLAQLIAASRTLYAMGERAQMPKSVSFVHPRWRTPLVAIVIASVGAWIATLASTFTTAITIAVGTRVLSYVVVCAALPVLRRRVDVPAARFRLPAGDLIAGIAILASLGLLAAAKASEAIELGVLVGIGLAVQRLLRRDM
jgi:APA family basic amino acid/polyamine antiporter